MRKRNENEQVYKDIYQDMIDDGYITNTDLCKKLGYDKSNIVNVFHHFERLGLLVYEDKIKIPSKKGIGMKTACVTRAFV